MTPDVPDPEGISGRRSLGYLVSGTVFSQGIQFASSLFLARLYTPAEFGQYASILSIATVLGSVIVLAYPTAVPLAETDEESRVLAWLGIALASVFAMITTLVLAGLLVGSVSIFGYTPDWRHVVFVPLTALAVAAWSTLQFRQSRLGGFARISRAAASGASSQVSIQIVTGWVGFGASGLSTGYLAGRLLNVALLIRGSRLGKPPRRSELKRAARKWSELPKWMLPTLVMNLLGTTAITPWVAYQYGLSTAGAFAFALQMLSAPAALIGQAVSTVLFPRLARLEYQGGVAAEAMERYVSVLASVAFPIFLPVLVLGPELFSMTFGEAWSQAGIIAAVVTPWIAFNFVSSPLSSLGVVKGRYRRVTVIATLEAASRFLAISVGGIIGSEMVGFSLYSMAGIASAIYSIAWVLMLAGVRLSHLVLGNGRTLLVSMALILALFASRLIAPTWLVAAVTVIVSSAAATRAVANLRRPGRSRGFRKGSPS